MKDKDTHAVYPPNEEDAKARSRATMFVVMFMLGMLVFIGLCVLGVR